VTDQQPDEADDQETSDRQRRRGKPSPAEQRRIADVWRRFQSPETTRAMDSIRRMLADGPAGQLGRQISAQANAHLAQIIRDSGIFAPPQAMIANFLGSPAMTSYLQSVARSPAIAAIAESAAAAIDIRSLLPNYQQLLGRLAPKIDMAWFAELFRRHQPANWNDAVDADEVHTLDLLDLAKEGWPTTWVPGAPTLRALLLADPDDRAEVLIAHRGDVLDDCDAALAPIDHGPCLDHAQLLTQAVAAVRAGVPGPAQALAANIIDTAIRATMSPWQSYKHWLRMQPDDTDFTIGQLRHVATMAPVRPALDNFHDGDPIPATFNRHATTHAVGAIQYTELNALVAVLLAVSITREFHEQHREAEQ
jgi:hypothetical protein